MKWFTAKPSDKETNDSSIQTRAATTSLQSEADILSESGGNTRLQGTQVKAQNFTVNAGVGAGADPNAKIIIEGVKETLQTSHTEKSESVVWQSMSGNGVTEETLKLAQINAKTKFSAPGGIDVQLPAGDPLKEQIKTLSQQPGMEWLNDLSQRKDVNWQEIKLAKDSWSYDQQGLTPAGAAILAIAIAAYTGGMGAELLGSTATAATGASTTALAGTTLATTTAATATTAAITTYTAAGAAINAGFSALAAQAGVSLVNNGGDIGKTLDQLGDSSTVKNILAAMTTAGVGTAYAGTYTAESTLANVAAGCASSAIGGGKCEQGATIAAGLQGLSYLGDLARKDQIASSAKFPGVVDADGNVVTNLSGQSAGINGDLSKIGGERLSIDKICSTVPTMCQQDANGLNSVKAEFIDAQGRYVLPTTGEITKASQFKNTYTSADISPLGGLQGGQGVIFGNPYAAGSFTDKVVESFAGAHDWLNSFHYYNPLTGNNLPASLSGPSFWNPLDVFLAAPVGLSTLNTQVPILSTIKAGVDASKQETKK